MDVTLRPLDPARDFGALFRLYEVALADRYPVPFDTLTGLARADGPEPHHAVAEASGKVVGVALAWREGTRGALTLLIVDPDCRRRGVGTALLNKVRQTLARAGVAEIGVGVGAGPYLWHGVPDDLPAALSFFLRHGLSDTEASVDLVQDLTDYATPEYVRERARSAGVTVRPPTAADLPAVHAFEDEHFADWAAYFRAAPPEEMLLAEQGGRIVGTLLLSAYPACSGAHWHGIFGDDMGAFGCVGVREDYRGQGAGLALVAAASEELRRRAVRHCFVHWTWLPDWYGKLGYRVWRTVTMGKLS